MFTATFSKQERSGYIVTFSGTDLAPVTVTEEQKVAKPDNPTRDDAIFLGWYVDPEFNQIFDFSSPIMQDTIIYAKWQEDDNSYTAIKARSFPLTYHFGDSLVFS
ncbi:InlB B-repeat-containing protein [bacterium]|nr:InlB B-repeat-containing protein [bacterium]